MTQVCDQCGAEMVLQSQVPRTDSDAGPTAPSSEAWWDCACGRTIAEFSASISAGVSFTVEEERE